jgi:hypothetical protein
MRVTRICRNFRDAEPFLGRLRDPEPLDGEREHGDGLGTSTSSYSQTI